MQTDAFKPTNVLPANGRWMRLPCPSAGRIQRHWLLRPGALTAGLRQQGQMHLQVVREWSDGLSAQEAWMLGLPPGSPVWIREVLMSVDGINSVYARSFTPLQASHGLWQGIRQLRSRPLADMLYHDPQILRSHFLVRRLDRRDPMFRSVCRAGLLSANTLQRPWARCSVFFRNQQPLLVAECFLPGFWQLLSDASGAVA